jgi:hypothetical protein
LLDVRLGESKHTRHVTCLPFAGSDSPRVLCTDAAVYAHATRAPPHSCPRGTTYRTVRGCVHAKRRRRHRTSRIASSSIAAPYTESGLRTALSPLPPPRPACAQRVRAPSPCRGCPRAYPRSPRVRGLYGLHSALTHCGLWSMCAHSSHNLKDSISTNCFSALSVRRVSAAVLDW